MPKKCKISDIVLPESAAKELEEYLKKNFSVCQSTTIRDERIKGVIVCRAGEGFYKGPHGYEKRDWEKEKRIDMKTIILRALKIDLT